MREQKGSQNKENNDEKFHDGESFPEKKYDCEKVTVFLKKKSMIVKKEKIYGRVVREGKPSGLAMHQRLLRERLVRCWQNGS